MISLLFSIFIQLNVKSDLRQTDIRFHDKFKIISVHTSVVNKTYFLISLALRFNMFFY